MTRQPLRLPAKLATALRPKLGSYSYRLFAGGRGSGKSRGVAMRVADLGACYSLTILCVREFQVSIKDSFFAELSAAIRSDPWLESQYIIGERFIKGRFNKTEFIFRGLRRNPQSVKSLSGVDLTIIEEAEEIPENSYRDLLPTVFREGKSEVWVIWNPREDGSATDVRFVKSPPPNSISVTVNYWDNPFFPVGLRRLMEHDRRTIEPAVFAHIWEGEYLKNTKTQVFADKVRVDIFTPGKNWDGPYFGCDWGFAQDPTAMVKVWIHDGRLWVEKECGGVGVDTVLLPDLFRQKIPEFKDYVVRCDKARPETSSHMRRLKLRFFDADKWPGCVLDRVAFIRSFTEIVIHARCAETIKESRIISYKTNKAGDPLPEVVDKNNHYFDAIGYALTPLIKRDDPRYSSYNPEGL